MPELPILTYHRIGDPGIGPEGITISPREFEMQMDILAEKGIVSLTLGAFLKALLGNRGRRGRHVLITFDDGYEETYSLAWPILRERGLMATVLMTTGGIGRSNIWDESGKRLKLLSMKQILELRSAGWDFGSHGHHHSHLASLRESEARTEIGRSKRLLEEILGDPVVSFCYPYGECSTNVKQLVRSEGFVCAFASDTGPKDFRKDPFEIRRIGIFPGLSRVGFLRKVSGFYHRYRKMTGR